MKSSMPAAWAAPRTLKAETRGEVSGRPYVMFAATVVGKRAGVWGTMAMRLRRVWMCRPRMSRPLIVRVGGDRSV